MSQLAGKVALVTGARGGLGAAIAVALAQAGAIVAVTARRAEDGQAVVDTIRSAGAQAFTTALDVAELEQVGPAVDAIAARAGRLDIVVNNAGVIEPMAPIADIDPLAFDLAMRVNVSGPAAITAAAVRHMPQGGRIINILSGAALRPLHGWAAYCSSKAALLMLTRATDLELQGRGIRCFGVAPGLVDTGMQGAIRAARINEVSEIPRERLAPPENAAGLVTWLASGAADDLAGTMVDIRDEAVAARRAKLSPSL